jgi:hypothetical protein
MPSSAALHFKDRGGMSSRCPSMPASSVTVFTLFPYSFSMPVGFQPIFSLIHYAYPFLRSHATYMDDTFHSRE